MGRPRVRQSALVLRYADAPAGPHCDRVLQRPARDQWKRHVRIPAPALALAVGSTATFSGVRAGVRVICCPASSANLLSLSRVSFQSFVGFTFDFLPPK